MNERALLQHPVWGNDPPSSALLEALHALLASTEEERSGGIRDPQATSDLPRGASRAEGRAIVIDGPTAPDPASLMQVLRDAMPWRKGPWTIHGVEVEAEWDASLKWDRMADFGVHFAGRRVADVGASNGWYMYRMQEQNPLSVIGLEPQAHARSTWELLQRLAPLPRALMLPFGVEHLPLFGPRFDLVLLMGLLYHHTDPVGLLRASQRALAPGGEVLVETIVVEGKGPLLHLPPKRYAGARGFWFLPTRDALYHLLRRAGFATVELSEPVRTTSFEQRSTAWREGPSLQEGLDPEDPDRTIEGLPAPWRILARLRP